MRTLYFDCFSGAGGDMLVGALLDAGVSFERLRAGLDGLGVEGFQVRAERVRKQGFAATKFEVDVAPEGKQTHRHLSDIREILEAADLPARVRARALAAFERLADAEAQAHGMGRDEVHFHEVGAVDAIVDIVGFMLALEEVNPDRIVCSALPVGSGTVRCEHGTMPVPAPATAILLTGVPLVESAEKGELLTPTAAALLTTVADAFGTIPAMTVRKLGMGAGTRETTTLPNLVRVMVGESSEPEKGEEDTVVVLEANLDDASGEWIGHCVARLLDQGARDAYCIPIYMKKNRPGVLLTAICDPADVAACETVIFEETSTFGIRRQVMRRSKLQRRHEPVETAFGEIRIKVGLRGDRTFTAAPEYEDCRVAAHRHGVPLRVVMETALTAWRGSGR